MAIILVINKAHQEQNGPQNDPRSGQSPANRNDVNMDVVVEDGAQMVPGQDYTNYDRCWCSIWTPKNLSKLQLPRLRHTFSLLLTHAPF